MKKHWCRALAVMVGGLSLSSCFTFEEMYSYLGYLPVQGLSYAGKSIGGCLVVRDTGAGNMVTNYAVEDLPGRAALYTGGLDLNGFGPNYMRQFPLRLGSHYGDVKIRDIGSGENGDLVGVGTKGSVFAFGGEECFRALDPITSEDLNTVLWSPILRTWLAGGDNGSLFRSANRFDWMPVPLPGLPEGTDFRKASNFAQGVLLVSDERITELTPGPGGGISVSYGIGFNKKFNSVANRKNWYLALAEDNDSGGAIVLERTDTSFNFASQFSSIFRSNYRDFFTLGDQVYFFRDDTDADPDNASTVEIRNYTDGQITAEVRLPITLDDYFKLDNTIYLAGHNRWDEKQIWRANLDFSILTPVTADPQNQLVKAAECLDDGTGPSWSVFGDDLDMARPGIQYTRYRGSERRVATIGGTSGSGMVHDTVRLSAQLALGVGSDGGKPLFFADFASESFALKGNGLGGIALGIDYDFDTGSSLITNQVGEVYFADLTDINTRADLDRVSWTKESLPWRVDGSISTTGMGGFFYRIQDSKGTENDIAYRDAGGNWSGFPLTIADKVNDLYYDSVLEKLFIATPAGLGYRTNDGQQGVLPIQIGQKTNLEFHKILGDRHGDRMHFVAGVAGDLEGPCMVGELGFKGMFTMSPSVEIIEPIDGPRQYRFAIGFRF